MLIRSLDQWHHHTTVMLIRRQITSGFSYIDSLTIFCWWIHRLYRRSIVSEWILSTYLFIYLSMYLCVCLFVCSFVRLSVCVFVCVCLFVFCLFVCLFIYLLIYIIFILQPWGVPKAKKTLCIESLDGYSLPSVKQEEGWMQCYSRYHLTHIAYRWVYRRADSIYRHRLQDYS